MKPSNAAFTLAKASEGLRLTAYPDPGTGGAPWTIGYGSTSGVKEGDVITLDQAEARLDRDLMNAAAVVNQKVTVPLTQNQFDALVDFVFNLGGKNFSSSTLLRKINAGDYEGAAAEFQKWTLAAGRTLPGLVIRRANERALFEGRA
ncbi:lysozyme [Luteibacter sp. SG786]|uniref:lysozyme n=1 Tax=Luteibacter sp. SG786 TaxID=2587130 RepID=UPI00141ED743|nr:lysozyme [Luteibacter sp. SG786]